MLNSHTGVVSLPLLCFNVKRKTPKSSINVLSKKAAVCAKQCRNHFPKREYNHNNKNTFSSYRNRTTPLGTLDCSVNDLL